MGSCDAEMTTAYTGMRGSGTRGWARLPILSLGSGGEEGVVLVVSLLLPEREKLHG